MFLSVSHKETLTLAHNREPRAGEESIFELRVPKCLNAPIFFQIRTQGKNGHTFLPFQLFEDELVEKSLVGLRRGRRRHRLFRRDVFFLKKKKKRRKGKTHSRVFDVSGLLKRERHHFPRFLLSEFRFFLFLSLFAWLSAPLLSQVLTNLLLPYLFLSQNPP